MRYSWGFLPSKLIAGSFCVPNGYPMNNLRLGIKFTVMNTTNFDLSSDEPTKRISMTQFQRRSLGLSQASSPGSKRGSMRISKPSGVAVSPHNIQRRRTTASHPVRASQTGSQAGTPYCRSTTANTTSSQRPMSWHPGSRIHHEPATVPLSTESKLGNTIAELETLAVFWPNTAGLRRTGKYGAYIDTIRGYL